MVIFKPGNERFHIFLVIVILFSAVQFNARLNNTDITPESETIRLNYWEGDVTPDPFIPLPLFHYSIKLPVMSQKEWRKRETVRSGPEDKLRIQQWNDTYMKLVNRVKEMCCLHNISINKQYNIEHIKTAVDKYQWFEFPSHKLFYCGIPKCASTSWKTYFLEDDGYATTGWKSDFHSRVGTAAGSYKSIKHGRTDYLRNTIQSLAKRFVIVRNPWSRLVSTYEDKIVKSHWRNWRFCPGNAMYKNISPQKMTFEKFVNCILSVKTLTALNSHVLPMTPSCGFCIADYNVIVRLEDLKENFKAVLLELNFHKFPPISNPRPHHKKNTEETYRDYYKNITDSALIHKLAKLYEWDFKLFGYPSSPFN